MGKMKFGEKAKNPKKTFLRLMKDVFEGRYFLIVENVLDIIADKTGIDIKSVTEEFKNDLKEEIMDTFSDVFNGISEKLSEMFSPDIELTEVAFEKAADELCVDMGTEIIGAADEIVSSAIEEAIVEAVVI